MSWCRPTRPTFSPYLLKIRQARPDLVVSNLAGNQITNFIKQYSEYGLQFPVAGFGFDTVVAWGAGKGNFSGIWPLVWHHLVDTPSSKKYVDAFQKKYGKLPDNQSWGDYNSLKIVAQSMNDMKSTDPQKLAEHLRKGREVRRDEGARGVFPRLRQPDGHGDVRGAREGAGQDEGPVGHLRCARQPSPVRTRTWK